MSSPILPKYLAGYPHALVERVQQLIDQERLGPWLLKKYPFAHGVRTDKALYDYVAKIKNAHLRNAGQINKVMFDSRLQVLRQALGKHTSISRVQGGRLQAKREIRIAAVFREMPPECLRMEPDYHQLEFDVRTYLSLLEITGQPLWATSGVQMPAAG